MTAVGPLVPGAADVEDDPRAVRPYAVTRGRTRAARPDLPVETLVRSGGEEATGTPEERAILRLTGHEFASVAELGAHLELPIGVVRVLLGDLEQAGLVTLHGTDPTTSSPATSLRVLESVLDGITAL